MSYSSFAHNRSTSHDQLRRDSETSTMTQALGLAEILRTILEFLEATPAALHAAILVSRNWHAQGEAILWRNLRRGPQAIVDLEPNHRRHFVQHVEKLYFSTQQESFHHQSLQQGLLFPGLRELRVMSRYIPLQVSHYFGDGLKSIEIVVMPRDTFAMGADGRVISGETTIWLIWSAKMNGARVD